MGLLARIQAGLCASLRPQPMPTLAATPPTSQSPDPVQQAATPSDEVLIWLAVYNSRRDDARQRVSNQFTILAGAVALAGALIPIVQHSSHKLQWQVLLFASVIFGLLGGLYLDQHQAVNQIGRYMRTRVWERLAQLVQHAPTPEVPEWQLLGWENWLKKVDRRGWYALAFAMSVVFRGVATLGAGGACIIAALELRHSRHEHFTHLAVIALVLDGVLYGAIVLIVASLAGKNLFARESAAQPSDKAAHQTGSPNTAA